MQLGAVDVFVLYCIVTVLNKRGTDVSRDSLSPAGIFKKVLEKASTSKQSSAHVKLTSPVVMSTCVACDMYLTSIQTLAQLKADVLAGRSRSNLNVKSLFYILPKIVTQ